MSPHKGPQIIKYCVITSTVALVAIAVGLIPQFKVNKGKLLCAEWNAQYANGEIQEPEEFYLKKESRLLNFAGLAEYGELRFYCENL